jgi:hypothetical protein
MFCVPALQSAVVALGLVSSGDGATAMPSAEELYQALQRAIRQLDSCRLVIAVRGDQTQLNPDQSIHEDVYFLDIWCSGDRAQLREMNGASTGKNPWWMGYKPLDKPVETATADQVEGRKCCVRDSGDVRWADLRPMSPSRSPSRLRDGREISYPNPYSTSQTLRNFSASGFFVPLVGLNRKWSVPPWSNAVPAIDQIAQVPVSQWRVVGLDELAGKKVVVGELTRGKRYPLECKRHSGELIITPTWRVWFSMKPVYFPLKMEWSCWYEWQGKRYDLQSDQDTPPLVRSIAGGLTDYGDGLWFPISGSEATYGADPNKTTQFDADAIVDTLLERGTFVNRYPWVPATHREWHVLKLERIDPETPLWFDPPKGVCVITMESGARRVEGMSEEDSRLFLGLTPVGSTLPSLAASRGDQVKRWLLGAVNTFIVFGLVVFFLNRRRKKSSPQAPAINEPAT